MRVKNSKWITALGKVHQACATTNVLDGSASSGQVQMPLVPAVPLTGWLPGPYALL